MLSPFPGMNPYLEQPAFWSSFHNRFMIAIANIIEPQLSDRYYVDVETRTYQSDETGEEVLIGIPDAVVFSAKLNQTSDVENLGSAASVALQNSPQPESVQVPMPLEIRERYLEIREVGSDAVITVIELLSPKNKQAGAGRMAYEQKRRTILGSATHLIEMDLLRGGRPMEILGNRSATAYRILVSRSDRRPAAALYNLSLQQALPHLSLPLQSEEPEIVVPLQTVFQQVFREARYGTRIDYRQPVPPPKLSQVDQAWVDALLAVALGERE
jgi:Protein of unknown function (DUF4058)